MRTVHAATATGYRSARSRVIRAFSGAAASAKLAFAAAAVVAAIAFAPHRAEASAILPGSPSEFIGAGTGIVNQSSATYDDGNGSQYYTTSNAVVVYIQNAPSVTVMGTGGALAVPGMTINDTFAIANTGNATATLHVTASVTLPGATASPPIDIRANTFANGVKFSGGRSTTIDAFNANPLAFAQGNSVSLNISYTVPFGTPIGPTTLTVNATLTQAASSSSAVAGGPTGAILAQSASAVGSATDTITTDAALNVATSIVNGVGSYRVQTDVQNSGGLAAAGSAAAATLIGAGTPGIAIVQTVPQCTACSGSQASASTLTAAPIVTTTAANGYAGGAPVIYYNHDGTATTWDQQSSGSVRYIAVFLPSINGVEPLNGTTATTNPAQSDGSSGIAPHPAVTVVSTFTYPTGFHSSDPNAYGTLSNAVATGHVNGDMIGPGFPDPSGGFAIADSSVLGTPNTTQQSAALAAAFTNMVARAPVTGASNLATGSAPPSFGVLNGPLGHPEAIGTIDGASTAGTTGDFTAFVLLGNAQGETTRSINTATDTTSATTTSLPSEGVYAVENTLRNMGTTDDSFVLASINAFTPFAGARMLPQGWTVAFYPANADNSIGSTPIVSTPMVHSGDTLDYFAVYSPPQNAQLALFTPYEAIVSATSTKSTTAVHVAGSGSAANDPTTHVMFANGFVQLSKTVLSDGVPCGTDAQPTSATAAVSGLAACPGAMLTYSVGYRNLAPDPGAGGGNGNISLTARNFAIVEDGRGAADPAAAVNASNWAAFSSGLAAAATDTGTAATADDAAAFAARWDGNTAGSATFTDRIGTLTPGAAGVMQFSIRITPQTGATPPPQRNGGPA